MAETIFTIYTSGALVAFIFALIDWDHDPKVFETFGEVVAFSIGWPVFLGRSVWSQGKVLWKKL